MNITPEQRKEMFKRSSAPSSWPTIYAQQHAINDLVQADTPVRGRKTDFKPIDTNDFEYQQTLIACVQ